MINEDFTDTVRREIANLISEAKLCKDFMRLDNLWRRIDMLDDYLTLVQGD